ncbi:DUF6795 domain-containing protein [Oceanobacter mangrovi]|uniref:DUF6795 domain-containing protein n=1 Tax=Oceanobacter mangrovi TaxID=2862510 RepID=UPI001C8D8C81|nr:DUF6795 domain-containing protein [Oceanobacter mangrovi]
MKAIAVILCLIALSACQEDSVGIIIPERVCLFTGFDARLVEGDKPLANRKLIRTWEIKGREYQDETITDENGNFHFDTIWYNYRVLLEVAFVSYQRIYLDDMSEENQLWGGGKMKKAEFTEFGGKPENVICDILREPENPDFSNDSIWNKCRWNL